ncbi:MAG: ABC transporter ATP-binding protein [Holophaga sp.]|nr:ABC transporter ATP-binding protein [Holophaga sp.]
MNTLGPVLLEAENLEVYRGETLALQLPKWTLRAGEIMGLIGPNGAGKSTLLLYMAGLLAPAKGHLSFEGTILQSTGDFVAYRQRVTLVFQEPLLLDTTVEENIGVGLRLRGIPKAERKVRIKESAERFGVAHLLTRHARELSGGEAQRTSLARACAVKPQILLLDEPFSSLDPPTREALQQDLGRMLRDTGCTAILATHDLMEAACFADSLAVLRAGRVVQCGPVGEVVNHPIDEFVANFVGMETLLVGVVRGCESGLFTLQVGNQEIAGTGDATLGQELTVGVRPENVTISLHPEGETSARNCFAGRVTLITSRGPFLKVELDCGFFLSAYVTSRSREELGLAVGRPVFATFKATAVHLIRK